MVRRARIGILRARHDTSLPYVPDQACLQMFFHDERRLAVFDYWSSVTRGHLDFVDSALMPWVDITLPAGVPGREVVAGLAYDALAARNGGQVVGDFDGWIVLSLPGTTHDTGAGITLAGKPACTLPAMGNHTYFCHELGHVLGFSHSYGVVNNGIDWDGVPPWDEGTVYGDPYDLMSSASFGTRNRDLTLPRWRGDPTFSETVPAGWPNPGTNGSMGPAPAQAHLHQWDAASLDAEAVMQAAYPAPGATVSTTLRSAGLARGRSLLVLTPPGEDAQGRGRVYVELRGRHGWDRGLDSVGADLGRQAVVVHVLRDTPTDGVRIWYAGRVLVPLESDTDVAPDGTGLVVRVTGVHPSLETVDVEVTSGVAPHELSLTDEVREATLGFSAIEERRTPCGDAVTWGNLIQQTTTFFRVRSRGYGGAATDPATVTPVVTWSVAGRTLTVTGEAIDLSVATPQGEFTLQYFLDAANPSELVLVARGGERYDAPVTVTVTEAGGGEPRSATRTFAPVGWREGYSEEDAAALGRCLQSELERIGVRRREWEGFIERHPGFGRRDPVEPLDVGRLEHLAERVRVTRPDVAERLGEIVRLRRPVP